MINYPGDAELLRTEIAIAAARMIAEEGADYGSAKRKAAKLILGNSKVRGDILPDNAQIESEVRQYQALFMGDEQIQRLSQLRLLALDLMEKFAVFQPCLTGAVANGTAGEHSDIYLQLFSESSKDVAVFLLNAGIDYVVTETPHFRHPDRMVETLSFMWKHEGVHLILYELDDKRGGSKNAAGRTMDRLSMNALRALMAESDTQ